MCTFVTSLNFFCEFKNLKPQSFSEEDVLKFGIERTDLEKQVFTTTIN